MSFYYTPICLFNTHLYVSGLGFRVLREEDVGLFPKNVHQELPATSLQAPPQIGSSLPQVQEVF